ncbi:MAG TPA: TQO small subunit DoxD [Candidatus Baltobacteraceae bacterium]|nr:TQO small subunit DoxD [Candidatus Baltobacteraceae bacterium]
MDQATHGTSPFVRRAMAALRIYVGLLWLAYGTSKFEPNWVGGKLEFLQAVRSCLPATAQPFRGFLEQVVIPNQALFGTLIAFGETLVGVALVFGFVAKVGAAGGMFLSLNYFFATGGYASRFGLMTLELLLFVVCLFLLATPSNQAFALDVLIGRQLNRRVAVRTDRP